ncbi:peptidase associated/transthyretin-like domain-containing protein [Natrialbaceae archaeon A-gly3]
MATIALVCLLVLAVGAVGVTAEDSDDVELELEDPTDYPVWINQSGETVLFPIDAEATTGVTGGDSVNITIGDERVDGELVADEGPIELEWDDLNDTVGSSETFTIDVTEDGESVTSGEQTVEPQIRTIGDDLVLWHPLIAAGEDYEIKLEDDDATYANETTADRTGDLVLGVDNLEEETVSVSLRATETETDLLEDTNVTVQSPFELNATVSDDGEEIDFEQGVDGLVVTEALLTSSATETLEIEDTEIEDGTLTFDDTTVAAGQTLTLATSAGIAEVTLSSEETESLPIFELVALALLPIAVSGVTGSVTGYVGGVPRREAIALTAIIALGLGMTSVLAFMYVFGVEIVGLDLHQLVGGAGVLVGAVVAVASNIVVNSRVDRTPGFTAEVTVTNGSSPLRGKTTIAYTNEDSSIKNSETIVDGKGEIDLSVDGTWKLQAKQGQETSDIVTVSNASPRVELVIASETRLTVTDRESREPIPNATVRRTDTNEQQRTNRRGTVSFDPPEDGSPVDVEVSHEKFESVTETVTFDTDGDRSISVQPKTGSIRVDTRIGGEPISTTVRVEPDETFLENWSTTDSLRTDRNGNATADGLLIGDYRVEVPNPDGELFEDVRTSVTVREGRATAAEIDARFCWSLSTAQREQIERIRRDVQSLAENPGRDTTIPQYYGSVVSAVLDTVEALPNSGHLFIDTEAHPDEVADALIAAASSTVDAITDAMTTKRNVDLFAACADMHETRTQWDGECDLEDVLDRIDSAGSTADRTELKQRYEAVSEQIERQRRDVSEIAPAQEMLQQTWEVANNAGRGPDAIATAYVALLLLDAVEQLFDHDALQERLSRTVF